MRQGAAMLSILKVQKIKLNCTNGIKHVVVAKSRLHSLGAICRQHVEQLQVDIQLMVY
jgi:hypothetical protein